MPLDGDTMLKILILKVDSPSCLWGRVIGGPDADTRGQYDHLLAQMNLFYHDVTQDLRKLKPSSLEEGQVCVVFWSVMRWWCRAVVESVVVDSVSCQARCLLVDHGERLIVPSDQIRVPVQNFLQLPFWVRRFHLAGIKPTTLRVSVYEEKAELIPSTQWDSSATLYLHSLLQASTATEAVLLESESDSTSAELYLTVRSVKICMNDDLVAKKFALYVREPAGDGVPDEVDQRPVMLSSSLLTAAADQPPPKLLRRVMSPGEASDWPTARLTSPASSLARGEERLCPGSQSQSSLDSTAAERLLMFLNPGCSSQRAERSRRRRVEPGETTAASACSGQEVFTAAAVEDAALTTSGESGAESLDGEQTGRSVEDQTNGRSEEQHACSRLLEWLNPEPLNRDAAADAAAPSDPRGGGVLVHSSLPVEPCSSLDDAPIADALRRVLQRKLYTALPPADRYSWPAVARGINTVVVSPDGERPLSYLPPLLSHILLSSLSCSSSSSTGPLAVLLCPGWEKAQLVSDLLEELKVGPTLHPAVVLLGVGKDEAKTVRIPRNCVLLVTTPFSLVRLLSCHCFLFLRLFHLVLDEADRLFSLAPDQMEMILQHFQKVGSSEERTSCPQQLIAVAKRWSRHMEGLLANHMACPCVVVTAPEEAALYGGVQQVVLMTVESSKLSVLLGALDFNPDVGQKTLIIARSAEEVEDVFQAVSNRSAFCLQTHEGLIQQQHLVLQQWSRAVGPSTHVILVTTSESLKRLGVRDATCVVHYDFPASPKAFGRRLFCLADNFRDASDSDPVRSRGRLSRSVLLISERNARHVVGLLRFLLRTDAALPPELLCFAQGVHVAREDQKTSRPLCSYLKSSGVCRDISVCPDRHAVVPHLDRSLLPASGVMEVVPLYVKTASVFHGRIVGKEEAVFQSLAAGMARYYGDHRPAASEVVEGGLYGVEEDGVIHRVKVLSVPGRLVSARFIDVGKEEELKSHQLLQLPEEFHSLPGVAVEIVLCRVKPADSETDWHPKVTRAISLKIRGLQHRARAVLSLGNTVFVDPMVRVTQLPGMKTTINESNVQSEILNTGMGVGNPEHLDLLRALCQQAGHFSGSSAGPPALEVRIKAEEEVLAEAFSRLVRPPGPEPAPPVTAAEPQLVPGLISVTAEEEAWPRTPERGEAERQQLIATETQDGAAKTFHPRLRWYETSRSAVVTVKLTRPESQSCEFYADRVVYSGSVDGRTYRAELELHAGVAAERCCWEMKSNEPVLKLVKRQEGFWEKLVKNKNIHVSYDTERYEPDEDGAPNGVVFVENTGEDAWYVSSESDSD